MTPEEWAAAGEPVSKESPVIAEQPKKEMSPEEWVRAGSPIAQAKQEQTWWERINAPQPNEPFVPSETLKRMGIGAVGGAAIGSVFPGVGTPIGALSGAAAPLAEDVMASLGNTSDLTRTAAGFIGGESPAAAIAAIRFGRASINAISLKAGREAAVIDVNSAAYKRARDQVNRKIYGNEFFDISPTTRNQDEMQLKLSQQYLNGKVPLDGKVSDALRQDLYANILKLQDNTSTYYAPAKSTTGSGSVTNAPQIQAGAGLPKTQSTSLAKNAPQGRWQDDHYVWLTQHKEDNPIFFTQSQWFDKFTRDMDIAYTQGRVTKSEIEYADRILRGEVGSYKETQRAFPETMLRLIQNGGQEEKSISSTGAIEYVANLKPEARNILRENFDMFLEENMGHKAYGQLKAVEQQEGIAKARDLIPTIIDNQIQPSSSQYKSMVGYLQHSPEGKKEFLKGVMHHFSSLKDGDAMLKDYRRLQRSLVETKMLSQEQMWEIRQKIKSYDKKIMGQQNFDLAVKQALILPMASVLVNEGAQEVFKPKTPMRSIFSL